MMELKYKTHGTCSQQINVDIEDGVVKDVEFIGFEDGYKGMIYGKYRKMTRGRAGQGPQSRGRHRRL